jgi:hypothetical protein
LVCPLDGWNEPAAQSVHVLVFVTALKVPGMQASSTLERASE